MPLQFSKSDGDSERCTYSVRKKNYYPLLILLSHNVVLPNTEINKVVNVIKINTADHKTWIFLKKCIVNVVGHFLFKAWYK